MPQFSVYRNKGANRGEYPYLLDIQNDLVSDLRVRVVIPLHRQRSLSLPAIQRLTPEVPFDGQSYLLMTYQMAGIALQDLGEEVGDLSEHRDVILGAIDLLMVGF